MNDLVFVRLLPAAAPGRPKQGPLPSGKSAMYSSLEGLS